MPRVPQDESEIAKLDDDDELGEEALEAVAGGAAASGALKTIAAAQTDYNAPSPAKFDGKLLSARDLRDEQG